MRRGSVKERVIFPLPAPLKNKHWKFLKLITNQVQFLNIFYQSETIFLHVSDDPRREIMMDVSESDKKAALDAAWVDLVACFGIGKDRKADPHRTISHTTTVALSKYGIAERTAR